MALNIIKTVLLNPMTIGTSIGFGSFIYNLSTMEGIFTRPDSDNKNKYTLQGLQEYMKAPLMVNTEKFKILWGIHPNIPDMKYRLEMLQQNWIVSSGTGLLVGYVICKLI
jgi:hypothetical protein